MVQQYGTVSLGFGAEHSRQTSFMYPPKGHIPTFLNFPTLFEPSNLPPNPISSTFGEKYDREFNVKNIDILSRPIPGFDDLAYPKNEASTLFARALGIIDGSKRNKFDQGTELWKLIVRLRGPYQPEAFYKRNNYLHAKADSSETLSPASAGAQDMLYLYSKSETGQRFPPIHWKGIKSQTILIKNFEQYIDLLRSELKSSVDLDNYDPFEVSSRDKIRAVIVGAGVTAAMNGEKEQCERLIALLPNEDRARIELAHLGIGINTLPET